METYSDKIKDNSEKLLDNYLAPEQQSEIGEKLNHLSTEMGLL